MKDNTNHEVRDVDEEESVWEDKGEQEDFAVVPPNGGWGWLVVACAFYCNVVTDGVQLTFGVFLGSISESFQAEYAEVALAGALLFGVHLLMGPLCSGFSNVFGLRPVTITGSLISCFGVGITYFANCSWYLYFSYGILGGIGLGLVYMNSLIITGVYFTTLMPVAIAIVISGTGVGTMVFAALGHAIMNVTTWQNSFLVQAALLGSMGIAAISFKPLKPIRVKVSTAPSTTGQMMKSDADKRHSVFIKKDIPTVPPSSDNGSLRTLQNTMWDNYLEEKVITDIERRNRRCECCKCCRRRQKEKEEEEEEEEVLILTRLRNENLPRESYVEAMGLPGHPSESLRSVFERIEIKQQRNSICEPLRKSLVGAFDCRLMKSCSFALFTISGALQLASLLVVYIYEKDRCTELGFSEEVTVYFVISLGGANVFWRLLLGFLAIVPKVNCRFLAVSGIVIGGIATMCSGVSPSIYWQFTFCFLFGLAMASFSVFRLVFLIDLIEAHLIPNATGINLWFMGVLCIIFPPLFGLLMESTKSYNAVFISTGLILIASGLMLIGLKAIRQRELKNANL